MRQALQDAIAVACGGAVVSAHPIGGGDINEAYAVDLENGERLFVKTNRDCPPGMFEAEAHGLEWLRAASATSIPEVRALSNDADVPFLALRFVESGPREGDFDESLGRELDMLHRSGAPTFGLDRDNYIGRLPQSNAPRATWTEFYRDRRLAPQIDRARSQKLIPVELSQRLDMLLDRLEAMVGEPEPPARLHGDLWGGNLHVDERGAPMLIDPAAYAGHREIDLAMMRLFGGFGARVFAAYDEAHPLASGHEERVPLYQLYPLLVHVNLFGGSYVNSVDRAVRAIV